MLTDCMFGPGTRQASRVIPEAPPLSPWPKLTREDVHAMVLGVITSRRPGLDVPPLARVVHAVLPDTCTPKAAMRIISALTKSHAEVERCITTVLQLSLVGAWPGAINRPHVRRRDVATVERDAHALLRNHTTNVIVVWALREAIYSVFEHGLPHLATIMRSNTHWADMGHGAQDVMDIVRATPLTVLPSNVYAIILSTARIAKRRQWMRRTDATLSGIIHKNIWGEHINKFRVAEYARSEEMVLLRVVVASIPPGMYCNPEVLRLFSVPQAAIDITAYAMYQMRTGMSTAAIEATLEPFVEEFDAMTVTRVFMFTVLTDVRHQFSVHDLRGIEVCAPPGRTLGYMLPPHVVSALPPGCTRITVPALHSALLRRMFALGPEEPLPPTPLYAPACPMCDHVCIPGADKPFKLGSEYVIMYTGFSFTPNPCSCGLGARVRRGGAKNRPTSANDPTANRRWFNEERNAAHATMQCEELPLWGHAVRLARGSALQLCWMCGRRTEIASLQPWALCQLCTESACAPTPPPHMWFASCAVCHTTSNGGRPMNGVAFSDAPDTYTRLCATCLTRAILDSDTEGRHGVAGVRVTVDATPMRAEFLPKSMHMRTLAHILDPQPPPAPGPRKRSRPPPEAPPAAAHHTEPCHADLAVFTVSHPGPQDAPPPPTDHDNDVFTSAATDHCVVCFTRGNTLFMKPTAAARVVRLCAHCILTALCTPRRIPLMHTLFTESSRFLVLDTSRRITICVIEVERGDVAEHACTMPAAPPGADRSAHTRPCVQCSTPVELTGPTPQGRYVRDGANHFLYCARCFIAHLTQTCVRSSNRGRTLMPFLLVDRRGTPEALTQVAVHRATVHRATRRFRLPFTTEVMVEMYIRELHFLSRLLRPLFKHSDRDDNSLHTGGGPGCNPETLRILDALDAPFKPAPFNPRPPMP